jgi:CBS domain-containing protein
MALLARDIMTAKPVCCTPGTTLDQVARLMSKHDCGQIPVVDGNEEPIGVITDRDIVSRVVAESRDPAEHTVGQFMSQPVVTVRAEASLHDVVSTMERHQIRRVPVVDEKGCCVGIIAQADIARQGIEREVADLVREVSRDTNRETRSARGTSG